MRHRVAAWGATILLVGVACNDGNGNAALHPEVAAGFGVAAYGDSLTAFYGGATWPAHLPAEWLTVVRANMGERAVEGADRLLADLDAGVLTTVENEEVVVLLWGTNDVCSLYWVDAPEGVTAAEYYDDQILNQGFDPVQGAYLRTAAETAADVVRHMMAAITRAQELGIHVVLAFPPPLSEQAGCGAEVAGPRFELLRSLLLPAAAQAGAAFVDLQQPFMDHPGGLSDLLLEDGVHLSPAGTLLAAASIQAAIEPAYAAWASPPPPDPPAPADPAPGE